MGMGWGELVGSDVGAEAGGVKRAAASGGDGMRGGHAGRTRGRVSRNRTRSDAERRAHDCAYWGSCVDLPQPVSPATTRTLDAESMRMMLSRLSADAGRLLR